MVTGIFTWGRFLIFTLVGGAMLRTNTDKVTKEGKEAEQAQTFISSARPERPRKNPRRPGRRH